MRSDILADLNKQLTQGRAAVLVTVIQTSGSTPRKAGSQMLVLDDGTLRGTIGGGQGEARSIALAARAMTDKASSVHHLTMNASVAASEGMACGGGMDVFIQYVEPEV